MKTHCIRVKRTLIVNTYIKAENLEDAMDRALRMEGVVEVLGEGVEPVIPKMDKVKFPPMQR